jgi:hypothetical protein
MELEVETLQEAIVAVCTLEDILIPYPHSIGHHPIGHHFKILSHHFVTYVDELVIMLGIAMPSNQEEPTLHRGSLPHHLEEPIQLDLSPIALQPEQVQLLDQLIPGLQLDQVHSLMHHPDGMHLTTVQYESAVQYSFILDSA